MYKNAHGNDAIQHQDAMCILFEEHVNKAQKRTPRRSSEERVYMYRRDMHVKVSLMVKSGVYCLPCRRTYDISSGKLKINNRSF